MRVVIDAREIAGQPTGVGRYLSEILAAWADLPEAAAHEYILCGPPGLQRPERTPPRTTVRTAPGGGTRWEQFTLRRLLRELRADVLFAPAYSGPVQCPVPMVVAIHDVSFAAHPEWFAWREGVRRRLLARAAATQADRVLTLSAFSKREIVAHLGADPDRVEVIPLGVSARVQTPPDAGGLTWSPAPPDAAPARLPARREPHVLYVGSLFNRRHLPALVDGFTRAWQRGTVARLDIVGDNRTPPFLDIAALAAASPASGAIAIHDYVSDEALGRLYAEARVFVFLSEYEGFGLTPLEALGAGVPAVVLDTPVAREVYGAAAYYVARPDGALVAEAIAATAAEGPVRERVLAAAPHVLARYSWHRCARRTLAVLVEAAGGSR